MANDDGCCVIRKRQRSALGVWVVKFKSEKDVRRWCKEQAQLCGEEKCLFWIEPKKGSTFGFPDLLYAKDGKLVPFELKLGQISNNVLVWKPRSSQAICTAKMILAEVDVFTIVGLKNTEKIAFLHARGSFLGKSTNWQQISGFEEIWKQIRSGSKFLFSSSLKTL